MAYPMCILLYGIGYALFVFNMRIYIGGAWANCYKSLEILRTKGAARFLQKSA